MLESLQSALKADAELLNETERAVIDAAIVALIVAAQSDDTNAIANEIKNVDKQTQEFAARRMDLSIRTALTGHSVDEV